MLRIRYRIPSLHGPDGYITLEGLFSSEKAVYAFHPNARDVQILAKV